MGWDQDDVSEFVVLRAFSRSSKEGYKVNMSPEDLIVEWMNVSLPQDCIGDGVFELYITPPSTKAVGSWAYSSPTMSDSWKRSMAKMIVTCARDAVEKASPPLSWGAFKLVWRHELTTAWWAFQVDEEPSTSSGDAVSSAGPEDPVCPDCKGSKQYVGIFETTPCYTCQGGGPS